MTVRRSPFFFLLLVTALACAAAKNSTVPHDSASSRNASETNSTATVTVSFCELCRDQNQCNQAYHGSPGIYCGAKHRRIACCCPADGVCVSSDSASGCACESRSGRTQDASVKDQQGGSSGSGFGARKIAWTVTGALVLCMLVALYLYSTRNDR